MNKREEMEQLAAEYLYDEISDADREKLMDWWKGHPEDQLELEELQSVINCLNTLKTETASSEPLRLYDVTGLPKQPISWQKWITAAAACVAVIICVSQGLVIEVGSARIALGPQPEEKVPPVNEQVNPYDEVIPVLLETVQGLQESNSEMLVQQRRLEKGLSNLSLNQAQFQTELALYNQKQFKQFAGEFVDVMDQKLRFLMPVSYIPANYTQRINDEDNTNSYQ